MRKILWFLKAAVISLSLGTSGHAAAAAPQVGEPDAVEMLEPLEVSSLRITRSPREAPWPTPQVNAVETESPAGAVAGIADGIERPVPLLQPMLLDEQGRTNGVRTMVRYLSGERPLYPRLARENGWQGKVIVRSQVLEDGAIASASVQSSSGYAVLDEAAVDAVKRWRFVPLMDGNFALPSRVDVPVIFDLRAS